ncbi:MAG: hypothetical protein IJ433_05380 [Ruminococcus sp.]|nr:hypothetical protein [Ruminococcus sp.]
MKRIITALSTLLLLTTLTLPCCAEAVFETAWDLNQVWAPSNYPDYVCGVWSNDGGTYDITIAVLNTDEGNRGKEEILELIEDDASVTFTYGEYSRNYLTDVQDELLELFKTKEEHGLISTALDEYESRIALGILKEYKGNKKTEELITNLTSQYGDIFTITYCDEPVLDTLLVTPPITTPITDNTIDNKKSQNITTIVLVLILITSIAFMVIRKRRKTVMQTNAGENITHTPLTEKEIEHTIKSSEIDYPQTLDKKILDEIESK